VAVGVSVGFEIGGGVAVEEGTMIGVEREAGLFVPQAFKINKVVKRNQ
jgi:hypothetical protein